MKNRFKLHTDFGYESKIENLNIFEAIEVCTPESTRDDNDIDKLKSEVKYLKRIISRILENNMESNIISEENVLEIIDNELYNFQILKVKQEKE